MTDQIPQPWEQGLLQAKPKGWNVPSRPRVVKAPTEAKTLWEAV